jgi:hypothetical protein
VASSFACGAIFYSVTPAASIPAIILPPARKLPPQGSQIARRVAAVY